MSTPLRIVFFGTSPFAVPALKALAAAPDRFSVAAVVSRPDKKAGRKGELKASAIAETARSLGLTLLQPATLKDVAAQKQIADIPADLYVVAAYGRIIPQTLLDAPEIATLNLHGSILPEYRGASPIQSAIFAGEAETGVSLMVMDAEIDHGPVIAIARHPIAPDDTYESLEKKLGDLGADLLMKNIDDFAAGKTKAVPQDHSKATFTKILSRMSGLIDWKNESAAEIERKIRAYHPWPGASTAWRREAKPTHLKILRTRVSEKPGNDEVMPGTIAKEEGKMLVKAKDSWLEILEVQPEGKKPMFASAFLNGYRDAVGTVFESPVAESPIAPLTP